MLTFGSRPIGVVAMTLLALLLMPRAGEADQWSSIQSPHFRVVGEASYGQLRSVARTMEQFRLATAQIFPSRAVSSSRPLTVIVVNRFTMLTFVNSGNVGGFYASRGGQDFIVMLGDGGPSALETALHEYQHLINHATWTRLPRWVDEGVAEFYSTFYESDGGRRYQVGIPKGDRLAFINRAGAEPLLKFLNDDGRSIPLNEGTRVGIFYAQAWALVHFFTFGDEGAWRAKFSPFVEALAGGEAPADAFRRTVTADIERFEARFRGYLRNERFTSGWVAASTSLGDQAFQQGKLTVAETETLRGSLMYERERARRAVEEAVAADPGYLPARALQARQSFTARDASATEALRSVAAMDPTDLYTCGYAMLALNLARRFEESLALCPQSNTIAAVEFERSLALVALGRPAESIPIRARLLEAPAADVAELNWRVWRYMEEAHYPAVRRAAGIVARSDADSANGIAYTRFIAAAAGCLAMDCAAARRSLKETGVALETSDWVKSLYRFWVEELDAPELLRRAQTREEQTEARAYIGLDQLARGNNGEALTHLKWVADAGSSAVTEYYVAVAHYRRLAPAAGADALAR